MVNRRFSSIACDQGFTLIEVMVAIAIIAISFSALLVALTSLSQQHISLRSRFWSQNIAWNKAVNIHIEARKHLAGRDSGQIDMLKTPWRWQVEVGDVNTGLYRIDIDAGELNSKTYSIRLSTFVGSPALSPGVN